MTGRGRFTHRCGPIGAGSFTGTASGTAEWRSGMAKTAQWNVRGGELAVYGAFAIT